MSDSDTRPDNIPGMPICLECFTANWRVVWQDAALAKHDKVVGYVCRWCGWIADKNDRAAIRTAFGKL